MVSELVGRLTASLDLLGFHADDLIGTRGIDLVHPDDRTHALGGDEFVVVRQLLPDAGDDGFTDRLRGVFSEPVVVQG
jgi:hypothetical protein